MACAGAFPAGEAGGGGGGSAGGGPAGRPGWSCRVGPVNELAEHRAHRGEITAVRGSAGRDVTGWLHADPVDVMPGVVRELGEERPLGPAVALPERVQGVDVSEKLRQPGNELLAGQAPQPVSGGEPAEDVSAVGLQMLGSQNTEPFAMDTVRSSPAPS